MISYSKKNGTSVYYYVIKFNAKLGQEWPLSGTKLWYLDGVYIPGCAVSVACPARENMSEEKKTTTTTVQIVCIMELKQQDTTKVKTLIADR